VRSSRVELGPNTIADLGEPVHLRAGLLQQLPGGLLGLGADLGGPVVVSADPVHLTFSALDHVPNLLPGHGQRVRDRPLGLGDCGFPLRPPVRTVALVGGGGGPGPSQDRGGVPSARARSSSASRSAARSNFSIRTPSPPELTCPSPPVRASPRLPDPSPPWQPTLLRRDREGTR